ncbi:hypothetical protein [Reticulibacter mediterranei]|uniref:hypothetical protein n=1 Tax=Reticulibacter mediterranei TaxID=2778369 RepID=UPI001C68848B|nr:hypothetical protein [Reticulibacter mediterranei]
MKEASSHLGREDSARSLHIALDGPHPLLWQRDHHLSGAVREGENGKRHDPPCPLAPSSFHSLKPTANHSRSMMQATPCPTAENVTSLPIEEIHEVLPHLKELLAV